MVDAGDANIVPAWLERGHAMVFRKVLEVTASGAIPIVLGGDHSITWPSASAVAQARAPKSVGIVHFDAHADTADDDWGVLAGHGTPMRRLIESGAVDGRNFVQVGLRGYWPPAHVFAWMKEHGLRWHLMREIEERGAEAVVDDAIAEALDGADSVYLSIDIDVLDPGKTTSRSRPGKKIAVLLSASGELAGSGCRWSDALRIKFDAQKAKLDAAIATDQETYVRAQAEGMRRAWLALDRAATENGAQPLAPQVWECVLPASGEVVSIVRTQAEAHHVAR